MIQTPDKLRALSVQQPWADEIVRGDKTSEFRSKPVKFRDRIYIYASLGNKGMDGNNKLPRGVVVGSVEIDDCIGSDGEYEWILKNPQRLPAPMPPIEQPQPVWFYPFGRPDDGPQHSVDEPPAVEEASDETIANYDGTPSTTRFAPVIATAAKPPFTHYHTKYLAYQLTRRVGADQADKLAQSLCNATVDLNPHQVDAALFAFRSPLSRGAILADEVGLGKTIEAGIVVSQLWAEKKRRILIVTPASLRKQWSRELAEKFFVPSVIIESKSYRELSRKSSNPPFLQNNQVVICSYEFARAKASDVTHAPWDLVIIDEAHRLRNVYKKDNKIARALRDALHGRPKLLLTATPLQNSLMELYGLVSFVDEHVFGSEEAFRELYAKKADNLNAGTFANLKARLAPICQRTLRKQVLEYVPYTNRVSITEDFTPTPDEQRLYDDVSAYLRRDNLNALPNSQRQLIELVLRKILASSSFAIAATLGTMVARLQRLEQSAVDDEADLLAVVGDDYERAESLDDEWKETDSDEDAAPLPPPPEAPTLSKREALQAEAAELAGFKKLAESIQRNAKGDALLKALHLGFIKAEEFGAKPKALIFTESRRTQLYLLNLLETNGYKDQIVLFNGTNTDPSSKAVYQEWLKNHAGQECVAGSPTADMRSALVEEFEQRAKIMIATESAAEGVNLQFCSMVVNYDLPWNPQRIEQRIGRCHRYGQKHDVVVINFVNRSNEADKRLFQLLEQKFKLFDGVFGASDEVLGAVGSGIDFEKRINDIHKRCRSPEQIRDAFDQLQKDLNEQITTTLDTARTKLLENFDEDVSHKLRIRQTETQQRLDRFGDWLWALTAIELAHDATSSTVEFDAKDHSFTLHALPEDIAGDGIATGRYRLMPPQGKERNKDFDADFHYRPGHPLAQCLIARAKDRKLAPCEITLNYAQRGARVTLIERLRGQSGWLRVEQLEISSFDDEETILVVGLCDSGQVLDRETCEKLLTVPASVGGSITIEASTKSLIEEALQVQTQRVVAESQQRNEVFFDAESDKLDRWADDLKENLEREIKAFDIEIRDAKKAKRLAGDLKSKIEFQKRVNDLEQQRNNKKKSLYDAQDEVENRKDSLIADVEARLQQKTKRLEVFTLRWRMS